MSLMETLALDSLPPEPWRNGGGVTRTIVREGDEWRVSIAKVGKDGPYSGFEGLKRVSYVLRGEGVMLRDAENTIELRPREAIEYDGDRSWQATLIGGPVRALNIMSKAGRYRMKVNPVTRSIAVEPGRAAIVLALGIGCRLQLQSDEAHELGPRNAAVFRKLETALLLAPHRNHPSPDDEAGELVVVTIEPLQE